MSLYEWVKRSVLLVGTVAVLGSNMALPSAAKAPNQPAVQHVETPSSDQPEPPNFPPMPIPTGTLNLKNADQINLLNMLSLMELQWWPSTIKKNHALINQEFIDVMSSRGVDAMKLAVQNQGDEDLKNRYVMISLKYMLLADLCAGELGKPEIYRLALAERYASTKGGVSMAMAIIQNILVTQPNHLQARLLSGRIRFRNGDYYGAMQDFDAVIKQNPNISEAWVGIAQAHYIVGELAKEKDALKHAVACTDPDPLKWREMARVQLDKLEHPQELPAPSDTANLKVTPPQTMAETADDMAAKGDDALFNKNNVKDAEAYYARALTMQPTNGRAAFGEGVIAFRKSEFDGSNGAIKWFLDASQDLPSDPDPLYYLALVCEKVYDDHKSPEYLDRAIDYINRAIQLKSVKAKDGKPVDWPEAHAAQERMLNKKTMSVKP